MALDLVRRNPHFARFWFGETVSLFGAQAGALVMPMIALVLLDANSEQVGWLRALAFLPFLLFALPCGAVADRSRKRPLMIGANAARAGLTLLVPLLAWSGQLHLFTLYGVVLCIGVCTVLFEVCWSAYVPVIVDRPDLVVANSRVSGSASAAEFAGPGLGGTLVQIATAPFALIATSAAYLASVISLLSIRDTERPEKKADRHLWREITSGLHFIAHQPLLRLLTVTGACYNFFYMYVEAVFVVYAVRTLDLSAGRIGMIAALGALGGILGAATGEILLRRYAFGNVFAGAVIVGYAGPSLIPLATDSTIASIAAIVAGFFLMRAGLTISNVAGISLRQAITPPEMMGRMTAGMRTVSWGVGTTGAVAGGYLSAHVGLRTGLSIAAAGFIITAIPLLASRIPRLRTLPVPQHDSEFTQ